MTSRRFSRKIMGAAYTRADGHCENCGVALSIGRIHYDHVKPWQTSRDSSLGNCACLCLPCHAIKTAVENHEDARADRARARHIGAYVATRPMPCGRKSALSKPLDGGPPVRRLSPSQKLAQTLRDRRIEP